MKWADDVDKAYRDGLTRGRDESQEKIAGLETEVQALQDDLTKKICTCGRTGGHLWDCPANPAR